MFTFLLIIHVIISIALILVILAQSSKGGALEGLGGGAASNMLGSQGASKFLKNTTQILAALFMLNCVLLAFQLKPGSKSKTSKAVEMMKEEKAKESETSQELEELPVVPEETKETNE